MSNQLAEKDEFDAKQKELESVVNPIMMVPCLVDWLDKKQLAEKHEFDAK